MTRVSNTLIATFLVAAAGAAFANPTATWEFKPGMAYVYGGPGKMSAITMAANEQNHHAMMKHAMKVPSNTVFFMDNGELYSVSGTLDPTGNFYRQ